MDVAARRLPHLVPFTWDKSSSAYDSGDNEAVFGGYNRDYHRSTWAGTAPEYLNGYRPMQDRPGLLAPYAFGSAHPSGFNMSFCDGSVHTIQYDIDPLVHESLGVRDDGATVDMTAVR